MGGAGVFAFNKVGELLLVKRRDVPMWVLPGGHIEEEETPEAAAIREAKEESGFEVEIVRKVAEYKHHDGRINHIYEAMVVGGKATLSRESKEVSFFRTDQLPELRHPHISKWLKDLNQKEREVIKKDYIGVTNMQALKEFRRHPGLVIRFFLVKMGIHINI